jgi:Pyruvate/2-oxoacid:ferredoxin oxidoreductase delta subunit
MALVKRVRPLGSRGGAGTAAQHRSSARPVFVPKEPPCAHACPAGTDVRSMLMTLARGEARGLTESQAIQEAFYLIADRNPLPAVCGRLCPHHCETGCTREPYDGGVSVNQVERAVAEAAIRAAWGLRRLDPVPGAGPVTVIGAGAAGLSAAYQLARRGCAVTLADPHQEAGGELRYGIEAERLPRAVLDAEVERILALGVAFAGGTDPADAEARAPRVVKTRIYEDGAAGATGAVAAAVHFGRHAEMLLVADMSGAPLPQAPRLPPVAKDRVQLDYHPHVARGETTGETWSPAGAVAEARRCLSCGACFECDSCYKYCPDQAVLKPLEPGAPYRFKLEFCQGCNKCAEQCPSNYIEMR